MNKKLILMLAAGALLVGAQQLQAASINGTIAIEGGADLDSNNLNIATRVDNWILPNVTSVSGDFTSTVSAGDAVAMSDPWTFTSGQAALWTVGGFTFDLVTSTIVQQSSGFLLVTGQGSASGNGFDPTTGTFRFSTQEPDAVGIFSFSASVGVPDGGATAMLLGLGVLGMATLRRKLS